MNKYQGYCKICKKLFSINFLKDSICENCRNLSQYHDKFIRRRIKTQICEACSKEFKDYKTLRYCSYKCLCILFPEKKRKPRVKKDKRTDIEKLNAKWLEAKPKKKKKPQINLDEVNHRAKKNLIFHESGWFHYVKGKKWNRL